MRSLTWKWETHSQTSCFGTGSSGRCSLHDVGPQSQRLWEKRGGRHRRRWSAGGRCTAKTVERLRSIQVNPGCKLLFFSSDVTNLCFVFQNVYPSQWQEKVDLIFLTLNCLFRVLIWCLGRGQRIENVKASLPNKQIHILSQQFLFSVV